MTDKNYHPGLEGVVAAETRLSRVNGQIGELIIGGYPLEELAGRVASEEVAYLLWHDRLPDRQELVDLRGQLAQARRLPEATLDLLRAAAAAQVSVMDALRMGAGTLNLDLREERNQQALAIVARLPKLLPLTGACGKGKNRLRLNRASVTPRTTCTC